MTRCREHYVTTPFQAPVGPFESLIARIQAEVLEVDLMGRTDSFFDFDGTSMDAIKICARIEEETGSLVPPHWLFETDVLADLVLRISQEAQGRIDPSTASAQDR